MWNRQWWCTPAVWLSTSLALCGISLAWAQEPPRPMYVISDVHLNVGRVPGPEWNALEDFRWPRAFDGLLRKIEADNPGGLDLVIAGDFLELWQHPTVPCVKIASSECGCTVCEMQEIVRDVIKGHTDVFASLGQFLRSGKNRVIVTPGNHDAALLEDSIWMLVHDAVPEGRDRVLRADSGTWVSDDGRVAVEHGHQQKFDVNYFPNWDKEVNRVTRQCDSQTHFFRPWGENFVQTLYNDVEAQYPLIDNLVPESAGVAMYWSISGAQGNRMQDVGRFLVFNILQTSFFQKASVLDLTGDKKTLSAADVAKCRKCLAEDMILGTDSFAKDLVKTLEASDIDGHATAKDLRASLATLVAEGGQLDDDAARTLCERAVMLNGGKLPLGRAGADPECQGELSMLVYKAFDPDGSRVLARRVDAIQKKNPRLQVYVFGHTHEARIRMGVKVDDGTEIAAFNTGAFQRLLNQTNFQGLKTRGQTDVDVLKVRRPEDAKACYPILVVSYPDQYPKATLKQWFMDESASEGAFLDACNARCSAPPANCKELTQ